MLANSHTDKDKDLEALGVRLDEVTLSDALSFARHFRGDVANQSMIDAVEPYSLAEAEIAIQERLDDSTGLMTLAVRLSDESAAVSTDRGQMIGMLGTAGVTGYALAKRQEIGFWLAAPYWGRGIMTTAIGAFCTRLFHREAELETLEASVKAGLDASFHVLNRNRFTLDRVLRDGRRILVLHRYEALASIR